MGILQNSILLIMNNIRSFAPPLLLTVLLLACGTDPRSALRSRMVADVARLQKEHVPLEQRANALKARYITWEKEVTGGDSTKYVQGLERTSVWVGDLTAIVESDAQFIAELTQAAETIPADKTEQEAFTQHYEELLEGHAHMVEQFKDIAARAEQRMGRQP